MNSIPEPRSGISEKDETSIVDVEVLIIGGGPTGLMAAYMLSKLEVSTLVIERYPKRLDAPKAHALSPRSLEICRQFGIDVNMIRNLGAKRLDAFWVNFVTSLTGIHVGRLPYERMDPKVLHDTPLMIHNIPQPAFEELVAIQLYKLGVQVRKNHSFVKLEQFENHVVTTVEDRDTKREYQICSKQVVGCDGAKSRVRSSLGITCEGSTTDEMMMTIHFKADLRPVVGEHVGMLHWIMDPEVSGFIIGYDLEDNQVLICNFDPKKQPVSSWDEKLCRKTITAAIGRDIAFDFLSNRPWIFSRSVAERYSVGNVFLAGDAAHSFPPTGGLGLNTGIGDVHNLAYKIAAVNQGWASPSLFSTYEAERKQIALVNAQQSVKNGLEIFGLLKMLGTTDPDIRKAKENLYARVQDSKHLPKILDGIEGQREHFNNHGLHIGYIYGDMKIPECASTYTPSFIPGARLPHVWLAGKPAVGLTQDITPIDSSYVEEFSEEEVKVREYSVLDICASDAFTIFADARFKNHWCGTVEQLRLKFPEHPKINLALLGEHFDLMKSQPPNTWAADMGISTGGAVIVRPDQHILAVLDRQSAFEHVIRPFEQHIGI